MILIQKLLGFQRRHLIHFTTSPSTSSSKTISLAPNLLHNLLPHAHPCNLTHPQLKSLPPPFNTTEPPSPPFPLRRPNPLHPSAATTSFGQTHSPRRSYRFRICNRLIQSCRWTNGPITQGHFSNPPFIVSIRRGFEGEFRRRRRRRTLVLCSTFGGSLYN
jgi:hypothetical protein